MITDGRAVENDPRTDGWQKTCWLGVMAKMPANSEIFRIVNVAHANPLFFGGVAERRRSLLQQLVRFVWAPEFFQRPRVHV